MRDDEQPERVIEIADLPPVRVHYQLGRSTFIGDAIGRSARVVCTSGTPTLSWLGAIRSRVSQVVEAAHVAFSRHLPLALGPEIVWYLIVHELAVHVGQHPREYARVFGLDPDVRTAIEVRDDSLTGAPDDDWRRAIVLFEAPVRARVGAMADLLLLPLSTLGPDDHVALLLGLMDTVQPYLQYVVRSLCGIPRVHLRGTAADWDAIGRRLETMAPLFPPLEPWFAVMHRIVERIHEAARGDTPDVGFWSSLYKYENGSGNSEVNGWITTFFAHVLTPKGAVLRDFTAASARGPWEPLHVDQIPAHVSRIPFTWKLRANEIPMVFLGGALGVDDHGVLTPRLGWAVGRPTTH